MVSDSVRLHGLRDFAQAVSVSPSLLDLVERAAAAALDLLASAAVSIGRHEPAHGQIRILRNAGDLASWEEQWPANETYPLQDYAHTRATATRAVPYWVGSVDDPETSAADVALLDSIGKRYAAAFPVVVANAVWGDVYVARNSAPFGAEELDVGLTFVGLLSSGLARLELLDDLARLAYTDPLTGLANRRAADDWLEQRLSAPEPFPPVSVLLCDINGLKRVNDAFGHTTGDELVRIVAGHLTSAAAELPDALAARIGGDEFVLLVDGGDERAVEKVVNTLAETMLPHGAGIAVGAATTKCRPAGAATIKTATRALMRLADAAQYRHKQTHRVEPGTLSTPSAAVAVIYPINEDDLADRVLQRLEQGTNRTVEWRLQTVCDELAEAFEVATLWVSRRDPGGPIVDILGRVMRDDSRGELAQIELGVDSFDPADYPATARAMAGGSYFASLTEGDPTERALLASMGYVSSLAAGQRGADGVEWLAELFGDPQTSPGLSIARSLLRAFVHLAVNGAGQNCPG